MTIKEYSRKIAEEIRLLFIGRVLAGDKKEKIAIITPKKSPNVITIYINNRPSGFIYVIKKDRFVVSKCDPSWSSQIMQEKISPIYLGYTIENREELHDYIISTYITYM